MTITSLFFPHATCQQEWAVALLTHLHPKTQANDTASVWNTASFVVERKEFHPVNGAVAIKASVYS